MSKSPSQLALDQHESSGARSTNCQTVLELVRRHNWSTSGELANWHAIEGGSLDLTEIRRRLTDLHKSGAVNKGTARRCAVKGSTMGTWWVQERRRTTLFDVEE